MSLQKSPLFLLGLVAAVATYLVAWPHCDRVGIEEDTLVTRSGVAYAPGTDAPYTGPVYSAACGKECDGFIFCGPVESTGAYLDGKRHGAFHVYDVGGTIKRRITFAYGTPTTPN